MLGLFPQGKYISILYFLIGFFNIFGLEMGSSKGKCVANGSETPDVDTHPWITIFRAI